MLISLCDLHEKNAFHAELKNMENYMIKSVPNYEGKREQSRVDVIFRYKNYGKRHGHDQKSSQTKRNQHDAIVDLEIKDGYGLIAGVEEEPCGEEEEREDDSEGMGDEREDEDKERDEGVVEAGGGFGEGDGEGGKSGGTEMFLGSDVGEG
ncbi:hypothetical protein Vadar_009864 [Vaccinium darrowii]|uniref:Uncharacterized protein n=1 Tax=Vaccinium darrowii TaxID=229202 RepID=A0ACB7XGT9_9ERIC|nr:hypothetical protein Vadar_009864 [Vaccinium darrowii]